MVAALVLALSLGLAACGGGEEESGGSASAGGEEDKGPIVIASWGSYFTEATKQHLADPFTEETGIEVQIVDAPGQQVAGLQAQQRAGQFQWDVLDSVSGPDAWVLDDLGLLVHPGESTMKIFQDNLLPDAITPFGYTFSNLGYVIACRDETVDDCPESQAEFFDTSAFPQARTSVATSPMVNLSIAALANGVAPEDLETHEIDLDQAFATLEKIKPEVGVWWESGDQMEQIMRTGEADMGILYSGRAFNLNDTSTKMTVNWSEGIYNPGYMAAVKGSEHEAAAVKFLEWVAAHPENQAGWAEQIGYSVPNPDAFDFLDEKTRKRLADWPANFEQMGRINFQWYVANRDEVNRRWQEFLQG